MRAVNTRTSGARVLGARLCRATEVRRMSRDRGATVSRDRSAVVVSGDRGPTVSHDRSAVVSGDRGV